jgi:hypothetical protein
MQYMLLIYGGEITARPPSEMEAVMAAHLRLSQDLAAAGVVVNASRLKSPDMARTVRFKDGARAVHDGPFPETREQLGGYYLIDVADMDAALAWAAKVPLFEGAGVEVRPLWAM